MTRLSPGTATSITASGLATATKQSDGTQKTQIVDSGGEVATVTNGKLDVNATLDTTGLATSAKQLADGHNVTIDNESGVAAVNIQDGGNALTVDGTVTANLSTTDNAVLDSAVTALETIDNAISGTEMQVDVVAALPAGTNAIGKFIPADIDITTHTNYARKYYTSTGAATDGIVWSPAAGKRWHITSLYFQTSADATITFEDDKAGGDDPVLKGEYKAGSGAALTFDEKYPMASGEDAADLIITTSAGNIYITVVGYEI